MDRRLLNELEKTVYTCNFIYNEILERLNSLPKMVNPNNIAKENYKIQFLIRSYVSEVSIFYNLLNVDSIKKELNVKLTKQQNHEFEKIRKEVRNIFQHIDEHIKNFIENKTKSYSFNIFFNLGSIDFFIDNESFKLEKLNEIIQTYAQKIILIKCESTGIDIDIEMDFYNL